MDKVKALPLIESSEAKDANLKKIFDSTLYDLQQIAIIQHETLKTMIRSLDTAEKKNKQRNNLLLSSEKLVNIITSKISEQRNRHSSKSASYARYSHTPDPFEKNLVPNHGKKSKRMLVLNSNRVSLIS